MKIQLLKLWDAIETSYWFLPSLVAVGAIALSFFTIWLDEAWQYEIIETLGWTYIRGPEGARAILATIAGSTIGVAGVTFSIEIVALQLASSQFGPRLLRRFMRDRGNQVVLATYISTFLYCLLVLRTIQEGEESNFVPHISVTLGVLLAIASIGVLIYFFHHAAALIQAERIIAEVGKELEAAIDRIFPQQVGEIPPDSEGRIVAEIPANFKEESCCIRASRSGYLQAIDSNRLMEIATECDLLLRWEYRPGKFLVCGEAIAWVWPKERVDGKLREKIEQLFLLGIQRTEQQDLEFIIEQLVEIAVRALSPSMNDPFTAIRCIDRLSAGLSKLVQKEFPSRYRYDDRGNLRAIVQPLTYAECIDRAFHQIRQYGRSSVGVTMRLLEAIAAIAQHTDNPKYRQLLLHHVHLIERGSRDGIADESDRDDIHERYLAALKVLEDD